ncbi:MAG TPA: hypothetical protein P5572_03800 [Phycisphaerae bacterium]|nr:hypothetical protein [Phycisphaerales bacterium]HRX84121.1 hypothetical protein [Phycisphaerae bacterium]
MQPFASDLRRAWSRLGDVRSVYIGTGVFIAALISKPIYLIAARGVAAGPLLEPTTLAVLAFLGGGAGAAFCLALGKVEEQVYRDEAGLPSCGRVTRIFTCGVACALGGGYCAYAGLRQLVLAMDSLIGVSRRRLLLEPEVAWMVAIACVLLVIGAIPFSQVRHRLRTQLGN